MSAKPDFCDVAGQPDGLRLLDRTIEDRMAAASLRPRPAADVAPEPPPLPVYGGRSGPTSTRRSRS